MEIREASFTKEEFYEVVDVIRKHKDVTVINPNGMVPGVWTVETKVGFMHYLEGGGGYDHWIAMTKNASNPYDIFIDDSNLIYLASDIYARKLEEKGTGSMSFVKRVLCGLPLEDEGDDVIGKVMQDFVEENPLLHAANAMNPKLTDGFLTSKVAYPKYLFHRTKQENLNKILSSNKLIAGTRSKCENVRVSMSTKINCDEFGPICFVIDADKLRCDYTIREFDYDKSMGQYAYESEWFTDTDIIGLSNYVVDITSDYDYSHDKLYQYEDINKATRRILALPNIEV